MDGGFVLPCTHALCSVRAVPCQNDAADVLNEKKRALTRASMACVREKDRMLWARRESCRAEQSLRSSEALACGVLMGLTLCQQDAMHNDALLSQRLHARLLVKKKRENNKTHAPGFEFVVGTALSSTDCEGSSSLPRTSQTAFS